MSIEDFCRCTPSEFAAVWTAWNEKQQAHERGEWERMRMECLFSVQPYSKKSLEARDIMIFPWEEEMEPQKEEISKDELLERYREAKMAAGLE